MSIFSKIGRFVGGAVKKVSSVVSPVVRVALSGAKALPVVGSAAMKSLSPGDTTVQEAEQRMGGQNAGAALALVGVAAVVLAAFVF